MRPDHSPVLSAELALALAVILLPLGPLFHRLLGRNRAGMSLLDGFVLGGVGALVLAHILPDSFARGGSPAVAAALTGLVLPSLVERTVPASSPPLRSGYGPPLAFRSLRASLAPMLAKRADLVILTLALIGLVVHSALDGAALTGAADPSGSALAAAVLIHRLPVGLLIWWLVGERWGSGRAALVLCLDGLSTSLGFFGARALGPDPGAGLAVFQALVAGSLVHVLIDHPLRARRDEQAERAASETRAEAHSRSEAQASWQGHGDRSVPIAGAIGALAGVSLLLLFSEPRGDTEGLGRFQRSLLDRSLLAAPFALGGFAVAALVSALFRERAQAGLRARSLRGALRGLSLGLFHPVPACDAEPAYHRLREHGASPAAALAFLASLPGLGLEAIALSVGLLGPALTVLRVAAVALLALAVGVGLGSLLPEGATDAAPHDHGGEPFSVTKEAWSRLESVVDHTAAWILLGLLAAAAIDATPGSRALAIPAPAAIPIATLLALPLYVCAAGATPIAASVWAAGLSPGAVLGALVAGPAASARVLGSLANAHGRRFALLFGGLVAVLSAAFGFATEALSLAPPEEASRPGPIAWACLGLVALLFLSSLIRQGPRAFVRSIFQSASHTHAHH